MIIIFVLIILHLTWCVPSNLMVVQPQFLLLWWNTLPKFRSAFCCPPRHAGSVTLSNCKWNNWRLLSESVFALRILNCQVPVPAHPCPPNVFLRKLVLVEPGIEFQSQMNWWNTAFYILSLESQYTLAC